MYYGMFNSRSIPGLYPPNTRRTCIPLVVKTKNPPGFAKCPRGTNCALADKCSSRHHYWNLLEEENIVTNAA